MKLNLCITVSHITVEDVARCDFEIYFPAPWFSIARSPDSVAHFEHYYYYHFLFADKMCPTFAKYTNANYCMYEPGMWMWMWKCILQRAMLTSAKSNWIYQYTHTWTRMIKTTLVVELKKNRAHSVNPFRSIAISTILLFWAIVYGSNSHLDCCTITSAAFFLGIKCKVFHISHIVALLLILTYCAVKIKLENTMQLVLLLCTGLWMQPFLSFRHIFRMCALIFSAHFPICWF